MRAQDLRGFGPVGTNGPTESFDAVLSDMLDNAELRWSDDAHYFADRLQSAHARELAEQQATIEALRGELRVAEIGVANLVEAYAPTRARADAAMGLVTKEK